MSELVEISQIRLQDHYSRETLNMNKKKIQNLSKKTIETQEDKTCQKK